VSRVFEHGYAVVVGVAGYRTRGLPELPLAVLNDAVDIASTLWDPKTCGYRADRVRLLLEEQATAEAILHGLVWLSERATDEDTAIFFFSGHGWKDDAGTHLAAHGASTESPRTGMISSDELATYLQAIRAGRLVVFLDSCFSGGTGEIMRGKGLDEALYSGRAAFDEMTYQKLATGRGRVLLASCGPEGDSIILDRERNSLFTSFLLQGLHGEAPARGDEGTIGIFDLFQFASAGVRRRSLNRQSPLMQARVMDNFPIALGRRELREPSGHPVAPDPSPQKAPQRSGDFTFIADHIDIGSVKQKK
jgi:hypothetical protein